MSTEPSAPLTPLPPPDAGQRNRLLLIVVASVVAVGLAIGGVVLATGDDDEGSGTDLSATTSAPCGEIISRETDRTTTHTEEPVTYADAPPAFGKHWPVWAAFGRPFYSSDRPEVSQLVHNLEHGFTIAWYDETAAEDEELLDELELIATDFQSEQERFVAVPWRSEDGDHADAIEDFVETFPNEQSPEPGIALE